MKIAVLDDGVHTDSALFAKKLDFDMQCINGHIQPRELSVKPASHGTVVAELIQSFAREAQIGSVKVLTQDEFGHIRDVIQAVKWCASHGADVIHMSIGTVQWQDFFALEREIRPLASKVRMAAARNNRKLFSLPSGLPGVWDVSFLAFGGPKVEQKQGNAWSIGANLQIPKEVTAQYGECIGMCNSYQAAAVTGFLAGKGLLLQGSSREVLMDVLTQNTAAVDFDILHTDDMERPKDRLAETPVAWILAMREDESEIRRLLDEFHKNDYYAMAVTDWEEHGQETIFWHSVETLEQGCLSNIVETYQCDLLLVITETPDMDGLADVTLQVSGSALQLYGSGQGEQTAQAERGSSWPQDAFGMLCGYYSEGE